MSTNNPLPPDLSQLCKQHGFIAPSRRTRLIDSTPRVGQYFWVDFPHDAYAPEFVGEHPGIVIRAAQTYGDTCIIIPVTSSAQVAARHIHKLQKNPNPTNPTLDAWAICSHLYTIHLARLRPVKSGYKPVYPKVLPEDMQAISVCIRHALQTILSFAPALPPPAEPPAP